MNNIRIKPLVGVVSDLQTISPHKYHTAGDKYISALVLGADVIPVIIPALTSDQDIEQWLSRLDGVFLTGSYSMVDPSHYDESKINAPYNYDAYRDSTSFKLIESAIKHDVPLLGVCRGLQDMNVALGGSLHQAVQELNGFSDHRENKTATTEDQYSESHSVELVAGGVLSTIYSSEKIQVNSLHSQGINRLGNGLAIEATAEDGLVEAFRVEAMTFGVAVQWHPEWKVHENPIQKQLFEAFGEACNARQSQGLK